MQKKNLKLNLTKYKYIKKNYFLFFKLGLFKKNCIKIKLQFVKNI